MVQAGRGFIPGTMQRDPRVFSVCVNTLFTEGAGAFRPLKLVTRNWGFSPGLFYTNLRFSHRHANPYIISANTWLCLSLERAGITGPSISLNSSSFYSDTT